MKPGVRALGVAESYRRESSTLAGVVVRADRVVDGFAFATCTVGGTDATATIVALFEDLDREDVQYLLVAGIAPAWFNVVDLHHLYERTGIPVLSVTFEASEGLEDAIRDAFDGEATARRIETYRTQPPRRSVAVDTGTDTASETPNEVTGSGRTVYVRSVGIDDREADDVVRSFTHGGGRPEPVRIARLAARAADSFRRDGR